MRRILALLAALALACGLTACGRAATKGDPSQSIQEEQSGGEILSSTQSAPPAAAAPDESAPPADEEPKVLVAYFSATGNTEGIARHLQTVLAADLYQIVPEDPYTSDDLNYSNDDCRANQEQNNPDARPAISEDAENMEDYDVAFLGYPIWWGQAPKIIYTFLERYDFDGVTIVPFCTSGSSGIGGSLEDLQALAPNARWLDGQRFSGGASESDVASWVEGLELLPGADEGT